MTRLNPEDQSILIMNIYLLIFSLNFQALTELSWARGAEEGLNGIEKLRSDPPSHVVTRGLLKKKS